MKEVVCGYEKMCVCLDEFVSVLVNERMECGRNNCLHACVYKCVCVTVTEWGSVTDLTLERECV